MNNNNELLESMVDMLDFGHELSDQELASLMQGGEALDLFNQGTALREAVIRDNVEKSGSIDIDAAWKQFIADNDIDESNIIPLKVNVKSDAENHEKNVEAAKATTKARLYRYIAGLAASVLLVVGLYTWFVVSKPEPVVVFHKQPVLTDKPIITVSATKHSVVLTSDNDSVDSFGTSSISFNNVVKSLGAEATDNQKCTITMPPGKSYNVSLSDGTQVWLYANSRLTYPLVFKGNERHVELQGEAYFCVAHDAQHPFIVHTAQMDAKVLGTEINVSSYKDGAQHVALVNGSVLVSGHQGGAVHLIPGQGATVNGSAISVTTENMEVYSYWRDGYIYRDESNLEDITRTLGHWYNVSVVFDTPSLRYLRLRFCCMRDEGLEHALELLNQFDDITATLENGDIHIK